MKVDGIGTPGSRALSLTIEEQARLARAARESVRRQIMGMLRERGVAVEEAETCPVCGEQTIVLDEPPTFSLDPEEGRICGACRAERDFHRMIRPDADIGGEGGG